MKKTLIWGFSFFAREKKKKEKRKKKMKIKRKITKRSYKARAKNFGNHHKSSNADFHGANDDDDRRAFVYVYVYEGHGPRAEQARPSQGAARWHL